MNLVLDHLALAVKDLEAAQKIYEDLGFQFSPEREVVPEQGVKTAFAPLQGEAHLELLEPLDESSPISKFIAKRGEGIHHLCFKVDDVAKASEELKQKGYQLIYDHPVKGAKNCWVNFIHPRSTQGVLIELLQTRAVGEGER